jgi:hypothetical protein
VRISSVLSAVTLGACVVLTAPLAAQGYRVGVDARFQSLAYRGWHLDSIPVTDVTTGSDGLLYTADGIGVSCLAGSAYCLYYDAGDRINAMPFVATVDLSVWNLGAKGLRFEGSGRVLGDFEDGPVASRLTGESLSAFPGTQPTFQMLEAYLSYTSHWFNVKGGRLTEASRFGYLGLDGGSVGIRAPGGQVGGSVYGGWSLARGALLPASSSLLNPLDDNRQPEKREMVAGGEVNWNVGWLTGRLLYERQADTSLVSSELAGGDLALHPIAPLTISGGLDYDFAYGNIGNAEATATVQLPKRYGTLAVGGRRYRPRFPLWSIWTVFSPTPYTAYFAQTGITAIDQVQLRAHVERYAYEETGASTALVEIDSDGWRYGLGASYRSSPNLTATLDYQAGFGPGAQAASWDGSIFWQARPDLSLRANAALVNRSLELRYADAKLVQFGLDGDYRLMPELRVFGGAWYITEKRKRPDAAGFDWNQLRLNFGLRYGFGTPVDRPSLPPAILRIPEGGAR